jgi:hypothetical protein
VVREEDGRRNRCEEEGGTCHPGGASSRLAGSMVLYCGSIYIILDGARSDLCSTDAGMRTSHLQARHAITIISRTQNT